MQNKLASGARLGRQALLFPLCLVLYEFSTYIGNDMIQPGMLAVVEQYQAVIDWVPTSMTAYLAGGMFLQWLLGPLSDRIGRRPVMLAGVVWFIITCLAILLAQNIEQFTLLRFLQGISLCFIGAVGYAAIQESFEEAVCIKITALMANVALIAPLLGPLVGAAWIHVLPWEGMFVLFAALAAISFFGLQRAMPETATRIGEKLSLKELGRDYKLVLKNGRFVAGALALGFVSLPLLAWIAQSPIIIITGEQLSSYEYGLLQVPIFGALIAGNLLLARLTLNRWEILTKGKKMPDCFVRSGILELMVMVVNLVFDNHPFTYAGKMANIRMRAVSRSWRRSHIDGLRHSRDADRLWNAD